MDSFFPDSDDLETLEILSGEDVAAEVFRSRTQDLLALKISADASVALPWALELYRDRGELILDDGQTRSFLSSLVFPPERQNGSELLDTVGLSRYDLFDLLPLIGEKSLGKGFFVRSPAEPPSQDVCR